MNSSTAEDIFECSKSHVAISDAISLEMGRLISRSDFLSDDEILDSVSSSCVEDTLVLILSPVVEDPRPMFLFGRRRHGKEGTGKKRRMGGK